MAVVVFDPSSSKGSLPNTIQVGSDASDNFAAIVEIEEWAARNGFRRSSENWLRGLSRGDKVYFVAVCFRPSEAELAAIEARIHERQQARNRMTGQP